MCKLVGWCFEPSQPLGIQSGPETNFTPYYLSYSEFREKGSTVRHTELDRQTNRDRETGRKHRETLGYTDGQIDALQIKDSQRPKNFVRLAGPGDHQKTSGAECYHPLCKLVCPVSCGQQIKGRLACWARRSPKDHSSRTTRLPCKLWRADKRQVSLTGPVWEFCH